jgi:hypothetical protein
MPVVTRSQAKKLNAAPEPLVEQKNVIDLTKFDEPLVEQKNVIDLIEIDEDFEIEYATEDEYDEDFEVEYNTDDEDKHINIFDDGFDFEIPSAEYIADNLLSHKFTMADLLMALLIEAYPCSYILSSLSNSEYNRYEKAAIQVYTNLQTITRIRLTKNGKPKTQPQLQSKTQKKESKKTLLHNIADELLEEGFTMADIVKALLIEKYPHCIANSKYNRYLRASNRLSDKL